MQFLTCFTQDDLLTSFGRLSVIIIIVIIISPDRYHDDLKEIPVAWVLILLMDSQVQASGEGLSKHASQNGEEFCYAMNGFQLLGKSSVARLRRIYCPGHAKVRARELGGHVTCSVIATGMIHMDRIDIGYTEVGGRGTGKGRGRGTYLYIYIRN